MKRRLLLGSIGLLACVLAGLPAMAQTLKKVTIIIPRDSAFVLNFDGAKDAGIFKKHGIDLDVDARPFAGFLAGLPSKQCMVTTYSGMDAVEKINQGVDWVILGPALTSVQEIFVRKDSPVKSITDMKGRIFGTFSTGAGSFKATRAAILDGYGIDIMKDMTMQELAPPALFKLFESGKVDSMFNISSLNVRAESEPDKFRPIFIPNDYWRKKTGFPIIWAAPLVAWRSWVEGDPKLAKNFQEATMESIRWLREPANFDAAVKKWGELAGVTKPDEVAAYKVQLKGHRMYDTQWNRKAADAAWQFLDMAKRVGVLTAVPPEAKTAMLVDK